MPGDPSVTEGLCPCGHLPVGQCFMVTCSVVGKMYLSVMSRLFFRSQFPTFLLFFFPFTCISLFFDFPTGGSGQGKGE